MKLTFRLAIFTLLLIAVNVCVKLMFAADLNMSGFSPLIAIALFSGMMVNKKNASFLLPLVALFASDVVIEILHRANLFVFAGFYKGMWLNYTLILLTTLIGWAIKGRNIGSMLLGAVAAPTLFFLASNFSVWYSGTMYPHDFSGLMTCYTAALPFYGRALMATVIFLPLIVLGYNYIVKSKPQVTLA